LSALRNPKTPKEQTSVSQVSKFPIVGIGASAGGLNAIQKLLENLPENTGLAFVVVQHLAADQESMLPEILSRSTQMPVNKVTNGMPVEINNIYVIPSGTTMTISDGTLKLHPKLTSYKPIDEFLQSLAVEKKTQAMGVILSGTGSDGTEGLKFIKAEGGITFAQDPKTAQYPDMPKNAIASETVYYVLSPEQIAKELYRIAKHPEIARQKIIEEAQPEPIEKETDTQSILSILQATFNVNFANYKQSTVYRRISRRMVINKMENIKKYVSYLRTHKDELQALFDDLLIGVTSFFREPSTFEALKEKVFPNITENQPIRIWIPGCSTGEEVYSIAIALEEFLEEKNIVAREIQIFGTDVNEKNIEKARHGVYQKNIEDQVPENQLKRFFILTNGTYQVTKRIRDLCIFARHDVTRDPPFSNLNMIVCRNLLIYFDSKLQERIIPLFHYGLKHKGFLILGEAESVGRFNYLFEPLTKKGAIFRRKQSQPTFEVQLEPSNPYSIKQPTERPEKADSINMLENEIDKLLMKEYIPAAMLLNNNLDVLFFRGKVNPYISVDTGVASLNVNKIVKKELRAALQTAVYRAKKNQKDVTETVYLDQGKESKAINIHVRIMKLQKIEEAFFFVLFTEATKRLAIPSEKGLKEADETKDQRIRELSEDLNATKLTLQTVIEQQEATNEELRSAMEEVQSSNEELMSTNEELETSKEELQSTNEELSTLNDELKNRNQTLATLNDDLNNLLTSVDTAVVIVDNDFRIRRFTNQAQELLRLMPTDIEHSISDIRLGIPVENLEKALNNAVTQLEITRQEIRDDRGHWYQMRVRPYLTQEKKVGGAILSFSDVTELKIFASEKQTYTENLELNLKEQTGKLIVAERLATIGTTAGMVGHDIRNPLQAIASDTYLIKTELPEIAEGQTKESIKESIASIENNIDYINKIVADLQDYSKSILPVFKETNLKKIFDDIISKSVPTIVKTSCEIEKDAEVIMSDPDLLRRAITNLVSNAAQAMPDGGEISIYAYKEAENVVITVKDTGMGIAEEVKPKLFAPLFTTKAKGQGFGLAVVKRITEALGGTIIFESEIGKGTKFIIRLPLRKKNGTLQTDTL
jgi:two-component system CheB/CheR fusion protein